MRLLGSGTRPLVSLSLVLGLTVGSAGCGGEEPDDGSGPLDAAGAGGAQGQAGAGAAGASGSAGQGGAGSAGKGGSAAAGAAGQGGAGASGQGGAGAAGSSAGGAAGQGGAGAAGAGAAGAGAAGAGAAGAGAAGAGAAGAAGNAGAAGGAIGLDIESPPPAAQIGEMVAARNVAEVFPAGDAPRAFAAFEDSGLALLDLADPTKPQQLAELATAARVVAVEYDEASRWAYTLEADGTVRVFSLLVPTAPEQLQIAAGAAPASGLTRVGRRLFVLAGLQVRPFLVQKGEGGAATLTPEATLDVGPDAILIAGGSDRIYVGRTGGLVSVHGVGADGVITPLGMGSAGGDFAGLVARGNYLLSAIKGQGLRALDLGDLGAVKVVYQDAELKDARSLRLFGRLLAVTLDRKYTVAIDVSSFAEPRPLTTNKDLLPGWVAAVDGNLLHGAALDVKVLGIPPFAAARVPARVAGAFPRRGRLPITLSKPVDPGSAAGLSVTCDGATIDGSVSVSLDRRTLTFLPSATLPAGAACSALLSGVKDPSGIAAPPGASVTFQTATQEPGPISVPKSAFPHTADGAFTGYSKGGGPPYEYFDVQAAQGMYSSLYADFDGERLWLLNDWYLNDVPIDPDCYNQFQVTTGDGADRWDIRSYGDQRIEVRKNLTLVDPSSDEVLGGYRLGASPGSDEPHTMFELGIKTAPGAWSLRLHDPGPAFVCSTLQSDPTSYNGTLQSGGGATLDPGGEVTLPAAPAPASPASGEAGVSLTPTLTWTAPDPAPSVAWRVELSEGADLASPFYGAFAYSEALTLPPGLLSPGTTYSWRVTSWNARGATPGPVRPFTTEQPGSGGAGGGSGAGGTGGLGGEGGSAGASGASGSAGSGGESGSAGAGGQSGSGGVGGAGGVGGTSGSGGSGGSSGSSGSGGSSVATCANGRFEILDPGSNPGSPGLVLDTTTGLQWFRYMGSTLYDYSVAVTHCQSFGMRLPTKDELLMIIPADTCAWPAVWQSWTTTPGSTSQYQVWGNSLGSVKDQLITNSRGALCVK